MTRLIVMSPLVAKRTMLRATSEIAVAMTVASVDEKPISSATSRPRCRAVTMSESARSNIAASSGAGLGRRSNNGSLRSGTELAVHDVVPGVHSVLSSPISGGEGEEDRPALPRRRIAVQLQEILDAQLRPTAVQLRRDGTRRRPDLLSERLGVLTGDLVRDQDVALTRVKAVERGADSRGLFLLDDVVFGVVGTAWIEQAVLVTLVRVVTPPLRRRRDCAP